MSGFGPFKLLDAVLLAVVAVSGLVAMYRGFTREVLSILSWLAAAAAAFYVTFYHVPLAESLAGAFVSPPQQMHSIIARIGIGTVVFLVVLIVVHLITSHISDTVLDSRVGAIDRILGFLFGAARGFILVVIPYMFAVSFICPEGATQIAKGCPGKLPGWTEEAASVDMVRRSGGWLFGVFDKFAPRSLSSG